MNHRQGLTRAIAVHSAITHYTRTSLNLLSKAINIPKSSFYRYCATRKKRIDVVGYDFFETESGIAFLARLMICVVTVFGIKEGVGAESIHLFFNSMLLSTYVACSTSKLREIKRSIRDAIEVYGDTAVSEVIKRCRTEALNLGVDETEFNDEMILLMMELQSGFIFTEVLSKNRTRETWWKHVGGLLTYFQNIKSITCDGGSALINLAKQMKCPYVTDLFHGLKDVVTVFRAKFNAKRKSLLCQLARLNKKPLADNNEQRQAVDEIESAIKMIDKGEKDYKEALFSVSTQTHPFSGVSTPQTSATLAKILKGIHAVLVKIAKDCDITDKYKLLDRFGRRIINIAILPDAWWSWANESVRCITNEQRLVAWALTIVLPYYYWKIQLDKSKRNPVLRKHYEILLRKAYQQLQEHPLTKDHLSDKFINWAIAMSKKYQRTSSQVEGRNGRLSQAYFNARGLIASHLKSLTILHNFFITREDGTTASERLCQYKAPNLIEHLVETLGTSVLAPPRVRSPQKLLLA